MKRKLLKIFLAIIAFIISGVLAVLTIENLLKPFISDETFLDIIQISVNIILTIIIYRFLTKNILKIEKA